MSERKPSDTPSSRTTLRKPREPGASRTSDAPTQEIRPSERGAQPPASTPTEVISRDGQGPPQDFAELGLVEPAERYRAVGEIGAGGMGEVRLVVDRRLGREVAMKVIHREIAADREFEQRFVHEAQLQARLEHPSIVPVYEVGRFSDGSHYFTMKRVRGRSLLEILDALGAGDADSRANDSQRRLLTAYSQVCLAVHYAHSHGVLHRDLKPANIMLGDFGEVYLLDWGVSKAGQAVGRASFPLHEPGAEENAAFGSPGYMAPELWGAAPATVQSDVYALGAILFEILMLEPLHDGESIQELLESTMRGGDARRRLSDKGVAPELMQSCDRALSRLPDERFASAAELAERIERYLDGDRDLELRRGMAEDCAARAEAVLTKAAGEQARAEAMEQAGRALALQPDHPRAAALVARLLVDPPEQVPREVAEELEQLDGRTLRAAGAFSALAYAGWLLALPLFLWAGVRDRVALSVLLIAALVATGSGIAHARTTGRRTVVGLLFTLVSSSVAIVLMGRILGPFAFVPVLAVVNGLTPLVIQPYSRFPWWVSIGCAWVSLMAAAAIEAFGLLEPSYHFNEGALVVAPRLIELHPGPLWVMFLVLSFTVLFPPGLVAAKVTGELSEAQRRLALQAWHLRRLMPRSAR